MGLYTHNLGGHLPFSSLHSTQLFSCASWILHFTSPDIWSILPAIWIAVWQHLGMVRKMHLPRSILAARTEFFLGGSQRWCQWCSWQMILQHDSYRDSDHRTSLLSCLFPEPHGNSISYKYSSNEFLVARGTIRNLCCLQFRSLTETVMPKITHRWCVP